MPKYGGKQIFSLGCFPEVGQKKKIEKKKEKKLVITMASSALQTPTWVAHAMVNTIQNIIKPSQGTLIDNLCLFSSVTW